MEACSLCLEDKEIVIEMNITDAEGTVLDHSRACRVCLAKYGIGGLASDLQHGIKLPCGRKFIAYKIARVCNLEVGHKGRCLS